MGPVLSFNEFHQIFEEEKQGDKSPLLMAAERILEVFFTLYGTAVPKIGDYADAIKDLRSIEKEKNLPEKGKKMQEVIAKVAGKISDPYKSIGPDIVSVGKKLGTAWKFFIEDEEAKKQAEAIQDLIQSSVDTYIQNLIEASAEKKKLIKPEEKGEANEAFNTQEIGGYLLLERLVSEERDTLMSALSTFKTELETQIKAQKGSSQTKEYRQKCLDALKKVNVFRNDLSDEKFEPLKRAQKKEKIDEIVSEIAKLKEEITASQLSTLQKIALKGRIKEAVESLLAALKEIQAKMEKIELEQVESTKSDSSAEEEGEEGGEVSVDAGDFKEIKVGGENASKKGANREAIKSFQVLYNTLNPTKKISEDGLFGRKDKKRGETEDAIVYTAKTLGNLLGKTELADGTKDGTILTPELQAVTKVFMEKLPELRKMFSMEESQIKK